MRAAPFVFVAVLAALVGIAAFGKDSRIIPAPVIRARATPAAVRGRAPTLTITTAGRTHLAQGFHGHDASGSHHDATTYAPKTGVDRDSHGRIKRSEAAKKEFIAQTGYPNGRPGYVVDHIIPLERGGPDSPSNMQWQTIEEAKAKDKWE